MSNNSSSDVTNFDAVSQSTDCVNVLMQPKNADVSSSPGIITNRDKPSNVGVSNDPYPSINDPLQASCDDLTLVLQPSSQPTEKSGHTDTDPTNIRANKTLYDNTGDNDDKQEEEMIGKLDVADDNYDDMSAPPLHLNAVRITGVRLQGSLTSQLHQSQIFSVSSRSSSRSRTSRSTSRDVSPSPSQQFRYGDIPVASMNTMSGTNHHHHHIIDPDILLDRLGLGELEPATFHHHNPTHQDTISQSAPIPLNPPLFISGAGSLPSVVNASLSLPSLPERLCEESLDDSHAFTDLKNIIRQKVGSGTNSGCNTPTGSSCNIAGMVGATNSGSVSGGSIMGDASILLETLEEFEDEDDDEDHVIRESKEWSNFDEERIRYGATNEADF